MAATLNIVWSNRSRNSSPRLRSGRGDRSGTKGAKAASRDGDAGDPSGSTSPIDHGPGADRLRVLVANEPLSYREAIAFAIRTIRPNVEVLLCDPEALDFEVERFSPDVVVCSHVTALVQSRVSAWVDLYPDGDRLATVGIDGRRTETKGIELNDLLSIIDQRAGDRDARG